MKNYADWGGCYSLRISCPLSLAPKDLKGIKLRARGTHIHQPTFWPVLHACDSYITRAVAGMVMSWLMCAPNVLSLSYIEFTGTQIMVTPDLPSPARMSWENCCAVPSQLSSHMCYVELVLKGVLLHLPDTMTPVKSLWRHWLCPYRGLTAMPCWWAPIRAKQLSIAATAWVILLCTCQLGGGQAVGWCMRAPCFKFILPKRLSALDNGYQFKAVC